jgi:hypothetical protein
LNQSSEYVVCIFSAGSLGGNLPPFYRRDIWLMGPLRHKRYIGHISINLNNVNHHLRAGRRPACPNFWQPKQLKFGE